MMDRITQDELIELISDLLDEEDLTYEEESLLSALLFICQNIELEDEIIDEVFIFIDKAFMDDEENDYGSIETEEDDSEDEDEIVESFYGLIAEITKRIRGGKVKIYRKGFKKVGSRFVKIKQSTLRKFKRAAKKRKHKKIKPTVKAKMMRSRKKVLRTKKSILKRLRKQKK